MSDGSTLLDLLRPYMDVTIVEQLQDLGELVPRVAELLDETASFHRFELKRLVHEHHGTFLATVLQEAMMLQVQGEAPVQVYTPV